MSIAGPPARTSIFTPVDLPWETRSPVTDFCAASTVSPQRAHTRPPRPSFGNFQWPDQTHVAFNFNAQSNLDYLVQSRTSLSAGNWAKLLDLSSAPTNRSLWFTNSISATSDKYFRLRVGP